MQSEYSVAILYITPEGIPLIRDPKKPAPVYWKLPGGRSENEETAPQCAVRELFEETGIKVAEKDLTEIHFEDRGSHAWVIFEARADKMPKMKAKGNEGEEIRVFSKDEILKLADLFPNHRRIIENGLK